jgi:hypothetical protein
MPQTSDVRETDQLQALRAVIQTASGILERLASDPLLWRLLAAYDRMPAEDRETVVGVIEREVELRSLGLDRGEPLMGRNLVPNPSARLYLRVWEGGVQPPAIRRDEVILAALRVGRILRLAQQMPTREWEPIVADAIRAMEPEDRAAIAEHYRSMLAMLANGEPPATRPRAGAEPHP